LTNLGTLSPVRRIQIVLTTAFFPCRLTFASGANASPKRPLHPGRLRRNARLRAEHRAATMHRSAEDREPRGIPGALCRPRGCEGFKQ
jgi:hypothetical protein